MSIIREDIPGALSVAQGLNVGGDTVVRGHATFDHDVVVEGWLDAPNIRGLIRGVYTSEELLLLNEPRPKEGWAAVVVDHKVLCVYAVKDGRWYDTGSTFTLNLAFENGEADMSELLAILVDIKNGKTQVDVNNAKYAENADKVDGVHAEQFLRSDETDVANGVVDFRQGLRIGKDYVGGVTGGIIDAEANAELESLRLRSFLEVPELRYNKVSVYTGVQWQTFGGGIVESVEVDVDENGQETNSGTITLKLEDGEIGAIAADDLCQGIWHNFNGYNESENNDERNGNFKFAGFQTVYFRVDEILDDGSNAKFKYVLRGDWGSFHPQPGMHFACYANPNNTDRQACRYSTTEYEVSLRNMNDWTYDGSNIYEVRGNLDGFEINGQEFQGTGSVLGNVYFYGSIMEWDNAPLRLELDLDGDTSLGNMETLTIKCIVSKGFNDVTDKVSKWTVTRESEDSAKDAAWNHEHENFAGVLELTWADLSENIAKTMFRFTAEYNGEEESHTLNIS